MHFDAHLLRSAVEQIPAGSYVIFNDIPSFAALTVVAPGVRFRALAILATPFLSFAMDFNRRRSSLVHVRRITFFFLANDRSDCLRGGLLTYRVAIATYVCEVRSSSSFNLRDWALEDCIAMLVYNTH